jgi:hypothetical protein
MSINRILNLGLLLITAAAGAAYAEVQAQFHLPFEAHWGGMTLAPGDYKVNLPNISHGSNQFVVNGADGSGFVQPMVADTDGNLPSDSTRSYLKIVKINGSYFVQQYRSGPTGKTFAFALPKSKHHLGMADEYVIWTNASRK